MKKLTISTDLSLPLDTVTATLVVYGGKGMGKTNLGSVIAEEFAAARLRFAVLDPMGVWWGLRHSVDGHRPGIEVLILGGIHGDIPIEPTGGAVVADLVVDEDADVVIDISRRPDGTMWAIGERVRFVTDYCRRLYQRQGEKRRPIMQVIDEAARFIPQTIRKGDDAVAFCMGAVAVLVEEGRNVGIGVTLITQRSARLNKDVAELADCMIAFRTVGPNSRGAVLDWLGEHIERERIRDLDQKIRSLPIGSALVVSPGWLEFEGVVAMRPRQTFDSSKTPRPGDVVRASGPGAKPDLAKYRQRMVDTIERMKANDPRELQKRVKELEAKLAKVPQAPPPPKVDGEDLRRRAQKIADAAISKMFRRFIAEIETFKDDSARATERMNSLQQHYAKLAADSVVDLPPKEDVLANHVASSRIYPIRPPRAPAPESNGDLGKGERTILTILAQYPNGKGRRALGTLSGYASNGGTFGTYLSRLRTAEYITGSETIRITDAGHAALGDFEPFPRGEELANYWLSRLGTGEAAILRVLLAAYPQAVERDELGRRAGYEASGGTFGTYLSRLRTKELIDTDALRASEAFFQ